METNVIYNEDCLVTMEERLNGGGRCYFDITALQYG